MKTNSNRWTRLVRFLMSCVLFYTCAARAANTLDWNSASNRVSADISSWSLVETLEKIAEATGWHVYLEPGTKQHVSVRFRNRAPDKALDLLLGELGRALLPPTNGVNSRLLVFRNNQGRATLRIQPKPPASTNDTSKPIANELVVTLKPGESIEELAKKLGAKVVGRIDGTDTYRLRFDDADSAKSARETLQNEPSVESVDFNYNAVPTPTPQALGPGSAPLNLQVKAIPDSDRVIVGLIDTAVQSKGTPIADFLLDGLSVTEGAQVSSETPTHGTSMAEAVLRGAASTDGASQPSRVRILPVDVYGSNPNTTTFDVAAGIVKAVNNGAMIVNLSLGSEGDSTLLQQVIQDAHQQGVIFTAAAGNQPVTTPTYPAAYSEVIAVTAGDGRGNLAPYANRGEFVDVVGPGTVTVDFNGLAWRVTGTSPATGFVSGIAAGKADYQNLSWSEVEKLIRRGAPVSP